MRSDVIERGVEPRIVTSVATEDALASERRLQPEEWKEGWNRMIDQHLIEWGRNPSRFDPEEVVAPSSFLIDAACRVAMRLRDAGFAPPLRVVPDGDGGITFEQRAGEFFQSLELASDGRLELITFHKSTLVRREPWPPAPEWT